MESGRSQGSGSGYGLSLKYGMGGRAKTLSFRSSCWKHLTHGSQGLIGRDGAGLRGVSHWLSDLDRSFLLAELSHLWVHGELDSDGEVLSA